MAGVDEEHAHDGERPPGERAGQRGRAATSPERPTIAYIVAAFNAADTVQRTIESILSQSEAPQEILVCDDGSMDHTDAVVSRFPRVRLFRQPNRGPAAALNRLVAEARADWVVKVDADDTIAPQHAEQIREAVISSQPDIAIVTTDAWVVSEGGSALRYYESARWVDDPDEQRTEILTNNFIFGAASVRRSTWLQVGGMSEQLRVSEDYDLWVRILRAGFSAALVDRPLYHYMRHGTAATADQRSVLRGNMPVLERVLQRSDLTPKERRRVIQAARSNMGYLRWLEVEAEARDRGAPTRRSLVSLARTLHPSRASVKALVAAGLSPRLWNVRRSDGEVGSDLEAPV
jgi:glycosyltransferase involved in cell wall biosynthesis